MFNDEATIKIKAGDGGDGLVSFRRERFVPKGGPDGGDGGAGGDVYLLCHFNINTLSDFSRKKVWEAENGQNGKPKKQHGKDGQDLILTVPEGTVVKNENLVLFDFKKTGEKVLVCQGGKGGWGNAQYATATRQSPVFAKKGQPGEEKNLFLELKLIAQIGIIGLPNSGKSTLLSRISRARPKIANYPFTTLEPNLGVVKFYDKELVAADIPGLIEGASEGKGLGDKFLRHIERTKILVHLLDIQSQNLKKDYQVVRQELEKWNSELLEKQEIVVLNKADCLSEKASQKICLALKRAIKKPVLIISAVSGQGIKELLTFFINRL